MIDACWHCGQDGSCDCILCGQDTPSGRKSGPCQACKGRDYCKRHRRTIDANDPRDRKNWRRVPAADGNKGYNVYLPLEKLK